MQRPWCAQARSLCGLGPRVPSIRFDAVAAAPEEDGSQQVCTSTSIQGHARGGKPTRTLTWSKDIEAGEAEGPERSKSLKTVQSPGPSKSMTSLEVCPSPSIAGRAGEGKPTRTLTWSEDVEAGQAEGPEPSKSFLTVCPSPSIQGHGGGGKPTRTLTWSGDVEVGQAEGPEPSRSLKKLQSTDTSKSMKSSEIHSRSGDVEAGQAEGPATSKSMMSTKTAFSSSSWMKFLPPQSEPGIASPEGKWRMRWESVAQFLILLQSVMVPFEVAFLDRALMVTHVGWMLLEVFIAVFFLADMVLNFRTAYMEDGKLVWDAKAIGWRYLHSWFILDLVAWMPTAVAVLASCFEDDVEESRSGSGHTIRFFHILRVLRVLQFIRIVQKDQAAKLAKRRLLRSHSHGAALRLGQAFLIMVVCMHVFACLWANVAPLDQHMEALRPGESTSLGARYLLALWWASRGLTFRGQPDPLSDTERALEVFTSLASVLILGILFVCCARVFIGIDKDNKDMLNRMKAASRFAVKHKLSGDLWQELYCQVARSVLSNPEEVQFKELVAPSVSEHLRRTVFEEAYGDLLRKFPPFSGRVAGHYPGCAAVPDAFIGQLASRATQSSAETGDIVVSKGEKATTMFFVLEGSLLLELGKPLKLGPGAWFGETALMFDEERKVFCRIRGANIRALEPCKLLAIEKEVFMTAVERFELKASWLDPMRKQVMDRTRTWGCWVCGSTEHWCLYHCKEGPAAKENWSLGFTGDNAIAPAISARTSQMQTLPDQVSNQLAPRPRWLPRSGPGNRKVAPEKWGMTLHQWAAFIVACTATEQWPVLERNHWDGKKVDVHEVCRHFVKPWTKGTGNSVALLMNSKKPLQAELMISHAWGESIIETLVAVLAKASVTGIGLGTAVWFCTFSIYQAGGNGDNGPTTKEQLQWDPFGKVIQSKPRYGMLVVHTSAAEVYDRLWCVYEVSKAQEEGVMAFSAFSMEALGALMDTGESSLEQMLPMLEVDTKNAGCSEASDEEMIRGEVEAAGGFQQLDVQIKEFRVASVTVIRAACEKFGKWAEDEEVAFEDLTKLAEKAAIFVGLHCLTEYVNDAEHDQARNMAREILEFWKQSFERSEEPPPGLDPLKVCMEPDTSNDAQVSECLADLCKFPFAVGLLEMAAGGSVMARVAHVANKGGFVDTSESSFANARTFFNRWQDGSGRMDQGHFSGMLKEVMGSDYPKHSIGLLFSIADRNRDSQLDIDEFMHWLQGTLADYSH